jgi:Tfp pilus assembly protein FimT
VSKRALYIAAAVMLLVLGVVAVVNYTAEYQSAEADAKADQLIAELNTAGLRAPKKENIVKVLGPDGGAVCLDPDDALRRGILYGQLTNGAAGPGQRPVIADNKVVQGQLLIIKVYCPTYLETFQKVVDDLKLEGVA